MTLKEIRIEVMKKGMTMTELAKKLNIDRRTMYKKISEQDTQTIEKIKDFLQL